MITLLGKEAGSFVSLSYLIVCLGLFALPVVSLVGYVYDCGRLRYYFSVIDEGKKQEGILLQPTKIGMAMVLYFLGDYPLIQNYVCGAYN